MDPKLHPQRLVLGREPMLPRLDWAERESEPGDESAKANCDAHSTTLSVCIISFLIVREDNSIASKIP